MFKLPAQIISDINNFAAYTSKECSYQALLEAKKRVATITAFKGDMERGMHVDDSNKMSCKAVSSSPHPGNIRFDNGNNGGTYSGTELIDDNIRDWAEVKKVRLGKKTHLNVNYADNKYHKAQGFMFNSIPSESEVKQVTDRVIKSTLRGGTVYG